MLEADPRLEAGARALCAFHGLNPDELALQRGKLVPMWQLRLLEARAVIEGADATDRATPEMALAGVDALNSGSRDTTSLVHKIWFTMAALRGTRKAGDPP
jgi:hypothetical protein